jgi:MFS family permease
VNTVEEAIPQERLWTKDFILLTLSNLLLFFGFQMLLPTLPVYVSNLGGDNSAIGLVIGIFTISAILIRPFSGAALDLISRKLILFIGLAICFVAIGAYYWATTIFLVLLLRIVHGAGWGTSTTTYGTIASDIIPASRRGEGMGYFGLGSTLAMALGPMIGIWVMKSFGFGRLFLISLLSTLLSMALTKWMAIPQPLRAPQKGVETRFYEKFMEKKALFPSFLVLMMGVTYGGIISFITLYGKETGIGNVGWFFLTNALFLFVVRPIAGKIFDQKGHVWVLVPGAIFCIIGLFLLSDTNSLFGLILSAMFYGIGFGAIQPSLQAWTIQRVLPFRRGVANATFYSGFDLGIGGGAMILGPVAQMTNFSLMYRFSCLFLVIYMIVYGIYLLKMRKIAGE